MDLYEYLFGTSIKTNDLNELLNSFERKLSENQKLVRLNADGTSTYYLNGQEVDEATFDASKTQVTTKNFKKDFINDSKNLETIKIENPFLKKYIENLEKNPNTEEKGVFIRANDPTTWNRPGCNNNSCYANSALWALLYNNTYKEFIKDTQIKQATTDLKVNVETNSVTTEKVVATIIVLNNNKEIVKKNLINFQNDIQNHGTIIESSIILSYTTAIMTALSKITGNNDLKNNFLAPDEFLQIISTVFANNSQINLNNRSYLSFPIIILTPEYTTIQNNSDKNITISSDKNDTFDTYSLKNELIIDYPKLGLDNDFVEGDFKTLSKQHSEKFYSIGKYKLYAFIHWQGGSHYVCYFEFNDEWYQFNDTGNNNKGSIKKVLNLNKSEIFNESFLFFYKIDDTLNLGKNVTITEYLSTSVHTLNITSSETELEDSIQLQEFNPLKKNVSTTFNNTQLADRCEQYGKEWLNLFINKNADHGSKTHKDKENNNNNDNDDDDDDEEDELTDDEKEKKLTDDDAEEEKSILNDDAEEELTNAYDDLTSQESFNDDIFVTPDAEELQQETFEEPQITQNEEEKKANELKAIFKSEDLNNFTNEVNLILADLKIININKNLINDEFNEKMAQVKITIDEFKEFITKLEINDDIELQLKQIFISEVTFLKKKLETLHFNADNIQNIEDYVNRLNNNLQNHEYFKYLIKENEKENELKAFLNSNELKYFTRLVNDILANLNSINNNKNEKNDEFNEAMSQVKTTITNLNGFKIEIDISDDLNTLQQQILTSEVIQLKKKLETLDSNADNIQDIGEFVNLLNGNLLQKYAKLYFEILITRNDVASAKLAELKDSENLNKIVAQQPKEIIRITKNDKLWAPIAFESHVYDINDVIFYDGVLYVKLQPELYYNTTNNTTETPDDITRQKGGTRRRNININGGTRKERGKTRKFIRYKNKLRTNKLRTNKLKTNKLRTDKLNTNKLNTNKLNTNKLKTNKLRKG
jgi:hypothetical protein